jgi:EAL and modified HD-GYP domain-containing signal transduction protein
MSEHRFWIGRQPILDRRQQIVGFELLFRSGDTPDAGISDYRHACASVINDALAGIGIQELLGRHKGYINMVTDVLMGDVVELLPKERVVIELLESVHVTDPAIMERCRELKQKGFVLALDDHVYQPAYEPVYSLVEIVKIDVLGKSPEQLAGIVQQLSRWNLTLIAEKVESEAQFQVCRDLGFDLFQGYYFAQPVTVCQNRIEAGEAAILQLIQHVLADDEIDVIEETFRRNPSLTFNLLRLVNSVSVGVREKIRSIRHAIMVLGREQLLRWLQLAVYVCRDPRGAQNPLLEIAAMRGRMMELLVKKQHPGDLTDQADCAFMTGVLSLIDVLFKVTMADLTDHLNLSDEICSALLRREGELGMLLSLAERLEQYDFRSVAVLMNNVGLCYEDILAAEVESINWSSSIGATG